MVRTIEYTGGPNPFEDIHAFRARLKEQAPDWDDMQVSRFVRAILMLRRPRNDTLTVIRFGADVCSANLPGIPAWPYLPDQWKTTIEKFPIDSGIALEAEDAAGVQREAFQSGRKHGINRMTLVAPVGLKQTYVWSKATNWTQQVDDTDAAILLSKRPGDMDVGTAVRNLIAAYRMRSRPPAWPDYLQFRDVDRIGPLIEPRSYAPPVKERYEMHNWDDVGAFQRDQERTPQWHGV